MASSRSVKWAQLDVEELFSVDSLQTHFKALSDNGAFFRKDRTPPESFKFPDFGAHELQPSAVSNICSSLLADVNRSLVSISDTPSVLMTEAMCSVWYHVLHSVTSDLLGSSNVKRILTSMREEMKIESEESLLDETKKDTPDAKQTANDVLVEAGVRTGLTVVFSLLKQAWSQLAWQKQIEQALSASGSVAPFGGIAPQINLPNEVLKSVLGILDTIPPLALSNQKALSKLSISCLEQSAQFLEWILQSDSLVDAHGKRLACEITFILVLQQGSLIALLEWIDRTLVCLKSYVGMKEDVPRPSLSRELCEKSIEELRKRTVSFFVSEILVL